MNSYGRLYVVAVVLLCLIAHGCAGLFDQDKPELYKRYNSVTHQIDTRKDIVKVSTFASTISEPSPTPPVFKLHDHGQMAFINNSAIGIDKSNLKNELNKIIASNKDIANDATKFSRTVRVVFSVYRDMELTEKNPADRISRLEIKLSNLPSYMKFVGWNRFSTEYSTVELGKIGIERTQNISTSISPTFSGTLIGSGSVSASNSRKLSEELNVKHRFITISGVIEDNNLTLFQEGISGIDLTGNFSVDLNIEFTPGTEDVHHVAQFGSLRARDGRCNNPSAITMEMSKAWFPSETTMTNACSNGIRCELSGKYSLRHVVRGAESIIEGTHDIEVFAGEITPAKSNVTLISSSQIKDEFGKYIIFLRGDPRMRLYIEHPVTHNNVALYFNTFEQAEEFLRWLQSTKATTVTDKQLALSIPHGKIDDKLIARLRVGKNLICQ